MNFLNSLQFIDLDNEIFKGFTCDDDLCAICSEIKIVISSNYPFITCIDDDLTIAYVESVDETILIR